MSVGAQYAARSPRAEQLLVPARRDSYVDVATTDVFPKKSCMCLAVLPHETMGSTCC